MFLFIKLVKPDSEREKAGRWEEIGDEGTTGPQKDIRTVTDWQKFTFRAREDKVRGKITVKSYHY